MNQSQVTKILQSIFESKNINILSNQLNLNQIDTKNIMFEALPKLLEGLNSNLVDEKSLNQFYKTLDKHIGVNISDGISLQEGEKILAHIFSNPEKVGEKISSTTGASKNESLGILSLLAPIVMSIFGNQKSHGAGKNDIASLITGLTNQANSGLMLSLFDKNHDGNVKNDIFSLIIGFFKKLFFGKRK